MTSNSISSQHIVSEAASQVIMQDEAPRLPDAGRPIRPPHDAFALAAKPAADTIPAVRRRRIHGATKTLVAHLLSELTPASRIERQIGVSRQRVDQILKQLVREGTAMRVPEPGVRRKYLWLRADLDVQASLHRYRKPLLHWQVSLLSCLCADSLYLMSQVAQHLDLVYRNVAAGAEKLAEMGLMAAVSIGQVRFFWITTSGLAYQDREPAASKAPAADVTRSFGKKGAVFIEALAVLGEARTTDLTSALPADEQWPKRSSYSGQTVQRLIRTGLAERIDRMPARKGCYRLTHAGRRAAALIASRRCPPARDDLEARMAAYHARQRAIARENFLKQGLKRALRPAPVGATSPAQVRIVQALESGPLPTNELRLHISGLARHRNSIHSILGTLAKRGNIRETGKRNRCKVWALQGGTRQQDGEAAVSPADGG